MLVLAGCGASRSESAVRDWSAALNRGDDEAAAAFFAPGARVVAGDYAHPLRTRADAVAFNRGLAWCGEITKLTVDDEEVGARFDLAPRNDCSAGGNGTASVDFIVHNGKIVFFSLIGA